MKNIEKTSLIPQPPTRPIIGNLHLIEQKHVVASLMKLSKTYGGIFRMSLFKRSFLVASSQEIVNELSDTTRFEKIVSGPLLEYRDFAGDGLFTAHTREPNWGKAHRILMPAFGPLGVRDMFDQMLEIANQMFLRWERFGPEATIDVSEDMTRLTLDTIALCGFGYRFNSFYQEDLHPFVTSMVGALEEGTNRVRRPNFVQPLMVKTNNAYQADIEYMRQIGQELIDKRREAPSTEGFTDLLSRMLAAVDPESGEKLDDENMIYQMVTFLIAGHETTSATLSFAIEFLLHNPDVLQQAREVVDNVLGTQTPRFEHLQHLTYIEQILMETLRLWPPAPAFTVRPIENTLLAGEYEVTRRDPITVLIPSLHRDPKVWGDEPEKFDPDRFATEQAKKLPPNAWKPFGNGARACIGRPFAMQEAQLVLCMMLQRFDFEFVDPDYQPVIINQASLKPGNLKIKARARILAKDLDTPKSKDTSRSDARTTKKQNNVDASVPSMKNLTALTIAYGSNAGSAEAFAQKLAQEAPFYGFAPSLMPLNKLVNTLHETKALAVVTASYEGQSPDNANKFIPYVESGDIDPLTDIKFGVFGCGNRQWARTYQAIPTLVDAALHTAGAERITALGAGDSGGNFFAAFDQWSADFWQNLCLQYGKKRPNAARSSSIKVEYVAEHRASLLNIKGMALGEVLSNECLVDMSFANARAKNHLEIKLPTHMSYCAGDYLDVMVSNSSDQVKRVLRRFGLSADLLISLQGQPSNLPSDRPVSCSDLLTHYVELAQPATRSQIVAMQGKTKCPLGEAQLQQLAGDDYEIKVIKKRLSVIDILEHTPACELSFEELLNMLPPMRSRQYSISSSPLVQPDTASLTIAVVDAPAWSQRGHYKGVASGFLAERLPGDRISVAVRPGSQHFRLPEDVLRPIIMVCAGSGIAPFRGFIQQKKAQYDNGIKTGPIHLFFGVRHPECDFLYKDYFKSLVATGLIHTHFSFSKKTDETIKYVQEKLWSERLQVGELLDAGAKILVCGDGAYMEPAIRQALLKIQASRHNLDRAESEVWLKKMIEEHAYSADVFN
jgi:cytochrome P450/NADPH-cytochrome P450 reductase